jgi:hypothetical protein
LRPAVARGAAQVLERGAQAVARGGARCTSQVFDLVAQAAARGCLLLVLDRDAQIVARGAATLSQQEKKNSADVQRSRMNSTRVQYLIARTRAIAAAASCSLTVTTSGIQRSWVHIHPTHNTISYCCSRLGSANPEGGCTQARTQIT